MRLCVYTCFVYLQPFCVTLDFKLFIDSIHILFLSYLLLWFGHFTIKNLQDFIKIYRALIKDIFLCTFNMYIARRFNGMFEEWVLSLNNHSLQNNNPPQNAKQKRYLAPLRWSQEDVNLILNLKKSFVSPRNVVNFIRNRRVKHTAKRFLTTTGTLQRSMRMS